MPLVWEGQDGLGQHLEAVGLHRELPFLCALQGRQQEPGVLLCHDRRQQQQQQQHGPSLPPGPQRSRPGPGNRERCKSDAPQGSKGAGVCCRGHVQWRETPIGHNTSQTAAGTSIRTGSLKHGPDVGCWRFAAYVLPLFHLSLRRCPRGRKAASGQRTTPPAWLPCQPCRRKSGKASSQDSEGTSKSMLTLTWGGRTPAAMLPTVL